MTREDAQKRIIVALDVDSTEKAYNLVAKLEGKVGGFKIGFEFLYSILATLIVSEYKFAHKVLDELRELFAIFDHHEFIDCKLADIPNTIKGAVRALCMLKPLMFDMHVFAGPKAMKEARQTIDTMFDMSGTNNKPKLLAVTFLTSIEEEDFVTLGIKSKNVKGPYRLNYVINYAELAQKCGCDGVIASPLEVNGIRTVCGPDFLIYTPGIRLPGAKHHDQKNVATPGAAIRNGATGVVVGRDITAAEDPVAATEMVVDNIMLESQPAAM
jgi:orotidine-5'-phosphate decarboxylase